MRFDTDDLRRVAWIHKRRESETRRMARVRERERDKRLERIDGEIHRCPGCGDWLHGARGCKVCEMILAERIDRALAGLLRDEETPPPTMR